ncbi:MAG TPA: hypothetical protein VF784_11910 [Anaerolineales bacterium]
MTDQEINNQGKVLMSTPSNSKPRGPEIDPSNVPVPFRPLIPYAEKWGISDDGDLDAAIFEAPLEELKDLITVVSEFEAEGFDDWLGNPGTTGYTSEWIAFQCLILAYDLAKLRLRSGKLRLRSENENQ